MYGVLAGDNAVAGIIAFGEVAGGSTGRKVALSVKYDRPQPGLHTDLFVKFSRDFDDPVRDREPARCGELLICNPLCHFSFSSHKIRILVSVRS